MRKTILLADDSVTIQKVVELTFMEEDMEVITVGTGTEALERLEEAAPDLVIADVHMPGADGFEVCRRVKAERPDVPVLLLVGTFEPFDADEVTAAGGNAYLKKPFDSQELIRIVEGLLEEEKEEAPGEEPRAAAAAAAAEEPDFDLSFKVGTQEEGEEMAAAAPAAEAPAAPRPEIVEPAEEAESGGEPEARPRLSDEDVDRVARRLVELLGPDTVREVAWEVVPDLAEVVIKDRLRELEGQVE